MPPRIRRLALFPAFLLGLLSLAACQAPPRTDSAPPPPRGEPGFLSEWGLVIHGGAGTIARETMTPEREAAYRTALESALRAGHAILADGGEALDAVVAAVLVLEDDSLFNAGKGAVFTNAGTHELDAAIMDGPTLRAGSVAGVTNVKNPIRLARAVMDQSEHVFMIGRGAEEFARAQGLEIVPQSYFRTEARWQALQDAQARERRTEVPPSHDEDASHVSPNLHRFGTVGAVALDRRGRLAAATSTGGMTNKRWGRVGDVPVIGAGTYANRNCGVSGTGWGEYFIMNTVARDICARMELGNLTLQAAADEVIQTLLPAQAQDTGGIVALSSRGEIVWSFNTPGMYRGRIDQDGTLTTGIYREDG